VISGDTLADFGRGLEINEKGRRPGVTREEIAAGLRPLLELPVEHALATHGGPTDRPLERALSPPRPLEAHPRTLAHAAGIARGAPCRLCSVFRPHALKPGSHVHA
jgi:hypothetical protein